MTQKSYAGFGSRETPADICRMMRNLARCLHYEGYMLRSGGSGDADLSFEQGAHSAFSKEIYVPWNNFREGRHDMSIARFRPEIREKCFEIAKAHHPAWHKCSEGAKKLHARNVPIILGAKLDDPVEFGICWTSNGKDKGGTGLGIRLCLSLGIPLFNLKNVEDRGRLLTKFDWAGALIDGVVK